MPLASSKPTLPFQIVARRALDCRQKPAENSWLTLPLLALWNSSSMHSTAERQKPWETEHASSRIDEHYMPLSRYKELQCTRPTSNHLKQNISRAIRRSLQCEIGVFQTKVSTFTLGRVSKGASFISHTEWRRRQLSWCHIARACAH